MEIDRQILVMKMNNDKNVQVSDTTGDAMEYYCSLQNKITCQV